MIDALVKMAARLNAVRVTVADLVLASQEVHKLPAADRDWEGRMHLMVRLFSGEPDKGLAIEHRLMAMSSLLASGTLPHWATPQTPDGEIQVGEPVWQAAATEPLLLRERDAYFEKDSFLDRVLSFAEPDGHA
jgi:hypothetical protein